MRLLEPPEIPAPGALLFCRPSIPSRRCGPLLVGAFRASWPPVCVKGCRMADDVPFDKSFDLVADRPKEVAPNVRAVAANNPSPFTFKGTVSYIIGRGKVAILDPGPDDDAHIAALLDAVRGETVTHIFVTHTHRDHSPAVPKIKAATGAKV